MERKTLTAIVVVDAPVETDRRVRTMIKDIKARGYSTTVVDARYGHAANSFMSFIIAAFRCWLDCLAIIWNGTRRIARFRKFWRDVRVMDYNFPFFTHYIHESRSLLLALYRGHLLRQRLDSMPDLVVANDLLAGTFAKAMLGKLSTTRLYYDAHEFSPFRNRENNSVARASLGLAVEAWVASNAYRMGCVSHAICDVAREIYHPVNVDYVPNAYYADSRQPDGVINTALPLHIVYFGAPSLGRGLQCLGELASINRHINVSLFVPDFLPIHDSLEWICELDNVRVHLGYDYEAELLKLTQGPVTLLSWCVIEDICLSYRLAEPSKFHQSRMFGIPVVVAAGQHLATLVASEKNGIILADIEMMLPTLVVPKLLRSLQEQGPEIGRATLHAWENSHRFPGWNWPPPPTG